MRFAQAALRSHRLVHSLDDVVADDFRPDVEGLRAVAVGLVLLFHADVTGFAGGFIGVDVFFVVSGFLITRLLLRELNGTGSISLSDFWARRARRLLPAAALVVLATVVVAGMVLAPLAQRSLARDVAAVALFVANIRFAVQLGDYFGAQLGELNPSPLLHFWSLAVEEQFYLLWPSLLLLLTRRPHAFRRLLALTVAGLGLASLAVSVWLTAVRPTWAFYLLPSRTWELLAGAAVALAWPLVRSAHPTVRAVGGWIGLSVMVAAALSFDGATAFPGIAAAVPVGATVLVLVAGGEGRLPWSPSAVLDRSVMQWIGRHSYAIYLWHWPILVLADAHWGGLSALQTAALVALSFVLAAISYRLVEDPVRRSPWLADDPRRGIRLGGLLCAGMLIAGAATAAAVPSFDTGVTATPVALTADRSGEPQVASMAGAPAAAAPTPTDATVAPTTLDSLLATTREVLRQGLQVEVVPSNLRPSLGGAFDDKSALYADGCVTIGVDDRPADCRYGVIGSPTRIVLYGDSHAAHWFPALERVALERGFELVVFTKGGCPTAAVSIPTNTLSRTCPAWRDRVVEQIATLRPAMVVMTAWSGYPNDDTEWRQGLEATVARIAPLTTDLVLLGDNPRAATVPALCLSDHLYRASACVNRRERAIEPGRLAVDAEVFGGPGEFT